MSNQNSRARDLLNHFSTVQDHEVELSDADHQAMKAIIRYMNQCCSPPLEPGNAIFDDDAYFFFMMGRAYERLAPGAPGTVQVAA